MAPHRLCSLVLCLLLFPCLWGFRVGPCFCYAVLSVLPSFAIILIGKREHVALLLSSS